MRPALTLLTLLAAGPIAGGLGGCEGLTSSEEVYVEVIDDGALDGRGWAYRWTVFEYGTRIGGFVEFFEIDGINNTADAPYFVPSACSWFGDGPLRDGRFVVAAQGLDGTSYTARATFEPRRRDGLQAQVAETGGTEPAPFDIRMVPDTAAQPDRRCSVPAGLNATAAP